MNKLLHIITTHSLASVSEQLLHAGLAGDSAAAYYSNTQLSKCERTAPACRLAGDSAAAYYSNTQLSKCERTAPACRASR